MKPEEALKIWYK